MAKRNKKLEKNKKNYFLAVFLFIIVIASLIFLIINAADFFSVLEKKQIYAKLIVSDKYGFDLNNTALTFGMAEPGGASSRDLIIESKYNSDVNVDIYVSGNISKFISISKNDFVLNKGANEKINFVASVPKNTEYGVYEGYVDIVIKK